MGKKVLKITGIIIAVIVALVVIFLAVMSICEYKPEDTETATVTAGTENEVRLDEPLTVMSWNTGYGALGDNADFFMDGGESVMTADKDRVDSNMENIMDEADNEEADIYLFQEVDRDSKRSHNTDEGALLSAHFEDYSSVFANNYKAVYVPYPWPPIGKVDSGILTLSSFKTSSAERISLPCPFSWPIRTCNLKRCLLVSHMPIEGSDKELVVINLHLEAYDSGEGKIEQTKKLCSVFMDEVKKGNYVIAGGDFNQSFSNIDTGAYPAREGLWQAGYIDVDDLDAGMTALMDDSVPTCRSLDQPYENADKDNFQYYMIDGFIVSDNISVDSVKTLDKGFKYTDHNPVVLKMHLQQRD